MKKIIVGILSFVVLFVAQNTFAANWNSHPSDCQNTVAIANYTSNMGYGNCWTSTSMSAEPGDTINVRIYYHNTSSVVAKNVRLIVNKSSNTSTSHNFTGRIMSDNIGGLSGNVNLTISSPQSLTFVDSRWFPNQTSGTKTPLPGGQSASDILTNGISIGDIAPGGASQGTMVAVFRVSSTVVPETNTCTITDFRATPPTINTGDTSRLSWTTTTGCSIVNLSSPDITPGNVANNSSRTISPTKTTPYTLTAFASDGSFDKEVVTVTVNQAQQAMSGTLTATPSSCTIATGANTCALPFTSRVLYAVASSSVVTHNGTTTVISNNGSQTFDISNGTQAYSLLNNSILLDTETVSASCASNSSWNGSYCAPTVVTDTCNINNFSASDYYLTRGERSTISWSLSNCDYATIYPTLGPVNSNGGSESVSPTSSTIYTLTARGRTGVEKVQTFQINVDSFVNNRCSITNFTASDTNISNGEYSTLRWNTDNCDSVKISYVGNVDESGTVRVRPASDTTYTLTAYNRDGTSEKDTVRIYVDDDYNDNNNYNTCYINSFTASNTYVTAGGNTRLNWSTQNCNYVSISTLGNVYASGSQIVTPYNNTNYILTAYGTNGGIVTRSVFVTVNQYVAPIPQPIPQPIYNACAVTTVATNVNQNSAQLNGIITGVTGGSSYFEYGTTINLGSRTNSRYSNSNITFYETVPNLAPNTIYFFRMVSDCNGGSSLGAIEVFRTLGIQQNNNVKQVIVQQGTTVIGTSSPIMLKISNKYELIGEGDLVDYIVNYKNIGKQLLTHPMVQVVLPTNITLVNSSRGTYSVDTHTLSAQVEDLRPGDEGVIFFQGKVDSIPLNNSQIATTAILIYTTPNGTQENAMAYVINVPKALAVVVGDGSNVLGGSAFFAGLLSLGFIGWLILILVILLIILIARSYSTRRVTQETTTHTTTTH